MAHLLRGKQAGIQNDLSAGLQSDLISPDDVARFGVNSQISKIAYDAVQSLLAVGTNETQFGPGEIYVFGQKRVNITFSLPRRASVRTLQFCADKLLCVDSKNDLTIFSTETRQKVTSYSPPGIITALYSDPSLDYVFIGTQHGEVLAYDIDRESLAPFKIPNLWKEQNPRVRTCPVVTITIHPRDLGTVLIGYDEGAVIFSFKQNKPLRYFKYHLPAGAPGGDSDPTSVSIARSPKLTDAVWHPGGTFIMTAHEDSSLVFWDLKDGRIIMARTLSDTNVDKPGARVTGTGSSPGVFSVKEPFFRIAWCANQDPEDTALLIAGGASTTFPSKGLTLFELGRSPIYATSSWQVLSEHFASPKRQRILPTPPNAEVVDFCLIPRSSPHFAGAHDPIAILALLSSGEIVTLSFPSGLPITPTNQLHVSLTFVHPFITQIGLSPVERTKWLGMVEHRTHGPLLLTGGAEAQKPMKRHADRNIVQTAHSDGIIRLWDAGHGDEIENNTVIQADVARALGRHDNTSVTRLSLAAATGELAVGTKNGEVVLFRWGSNDNPGKEPPLSGPNRSRDLTDVTSRKDPSLVRGLMPLTLLDQQNGPVSALKLSDVGFMAAGFEGGDLVIVDLRGPAIIFSANIKDFLKQDKRGSFRRSNSNNSSKPDWPTCIEFSVMTLDGDDYSSILVHCGTVLGHLATFALLPDGDRYTVKFSGVVSLDDRIVHIAPIKADSGQPAYASQNAVSGLRSGSRINGVLVVVTFSGARIFKPASSKGAQKSWDEFLCDAAAVVRYQDQGYALVGLFGDGRVRAYSIPALKEIGSAPVSEVLDVKRFGDATITSNGDIIGWRGPTQVALMQLFGVGSTLPPSADILINPELIIPPRPTISNIQWISGTQHVTPADMDLLIGGPDRPPSKRMMAQSRLDEQQRRAAERAGKAPAAGAGASGQGTDEGYWAYMQRQIAERTENLGLAGDSMDRLGNNSSKWADDVSKYVQKQKRGLVMGAVKSKFGF